MQQEDMVDRLAKIEFANPQCADCPAPQPRWASFLKDKKDDALQVEGYLSVMVCDDCAIRHHSVLGDKRCMLKTIECFHEWSHKEADIVLTSGNAFVNAIYESKLEAIGDFDKEVVVRVENLEDDNELEDDRRCKFIKNKYKKCKYRNDEALLETLQQLKDQQSAPPRQILPQRINRVSTWSSATTHKAGTTTTPPPQPKKSSSFLSLLHRESSFSMGPRVSKATKALHCISDQNSGERERLDPDMAPKKPDRCLSVSSYQPSSSVSSITWSEGRSTYTASSDYESEVGSLKSWWHNNNNSKSS